MPTEEDLTQFVETQLRDEHIPKQDARARGTRLWAGAEIKSRTFFIAEKFVGLRQSMSFAFVTTSIFAARQFLNSGEDAEWGRIYVRLRGQIGESPGLLLEELAEAYQCRSTQVFVYCLANGMRVLDATTTASMELQRPLKLTRVYSSARF